MKLQLLVVLSCILACSTNGWGSGYMISAHSVRSFGLASSYVANTDSADSAYFNPANMVWLDDATMIDAGVSYIMNKRTTFDGTVQDVPASAESEDEKAFLPFIHYVSPKAGNWRFGASILEPAGIAKRWNSVVQKATAEETMLRVIMINPSVAYMLNSHFSIGAGLRIIYAEAEMKAQLPPGMDQVLIQGYRQEMDGDTWETGFNLAATANLTESLRLAATFRSEIDMDIEGTGSGYTTKSFHGADLFIQQRLGSHFNPTTGHALFGLIQDFWCNDN